VSAPAIVFIGFMGAGKSTALRIAGDSFDQVWDADDWIERHVGMSIADYFAEFGEEAFRKEEAALASKLLRDAAGGVVALGGGAVVAESIRKELTDHIVVWLQVDAETAWERVSDSDRPLAKDRAEFDALFAERQALYESLADAVIPQGDPDIVAGALPWIRALADLPPGTKMIWATSDSGEYPIVIGRGILESNWWPLEGRQFYVCDENTRRYYADPMQPIAKPIVVEAGETAKTMQTATQVLEALANQEMTREDYLVALGGGVVGDLAGFCAHVYQRGVPVVQVPTTLVAQVDSAYGGKTGVDLPEGKNYAGAYHLPAAVIADTSTLATLPREELAAGFVEALKTGLLAGGGLWERVRAIESLDPTGLDDVVFACARYKCEVVAADERDAGLRQALNLGHTVGHAIEAASGYERYRHGEAIGLGLLAALRLSGAAELRDEVEEILARHGLPTSLDPAVEIEPTLAALQRDKKRTAAGVGFILLPEPGVPQVGQLVDPAKVRAAVEELYR
jgi:shikimate kinase/3-dehydroquinate synthase